jgi:uncharacterized protein with von Willebrand factor type A (vWA) domain
LIPVVDDLPLLDLFYTLREAGLPLGIGEYALLVRALQAGFGVSDQAALVRLCRILWVKSAEDRALFDYHFDKVMNQFAAREQDSAPQQQPSEPDHQAPPQIADDKKETVANPPGQNEADNRGDAPDSPAPDAASSPPETSPGIVHGIEDEVQVAQAVQAGIDQESLSYTHFIDTTEYFPVTRRQMKQSWRYLRRMVREGVPEVLDVEATTNKIASQGVFLDPVLLPRRVNRSNLLLLLDQEGSMTPFHILSRRLAETALRGGRLGKAGIYYFHNLPEEHLYSDPSGYEAWSLEQVFARVAQKRTVVMIFSDAGAARGGFNYERVEQTKFFLDRIKQRTRFVSWLNPMPQSRWAGTTAAEIARIMPMFELSRQGLDAAIDVLRGRGASTA